MRIVQVGSFAAALAMASFPAVAQQYYRDYQQPQWSHADEHRAHEAAHEAEHQAENARRDEAAGDYHGAAHARQGHTRRTTRRFAMAPMNRDSSRADMGTGTIPMATMGMGTTSRRASCPGNASTSAIFEVVPVGWTVWRPS